MPAIVPGLPSGGLPDQVLKVVELGRPGWADPESGPQRFRGEWAPDEIVKQYTFSGSIPPEFVLSTGGSGAAAAGVTTAVADSTANASATNPPAFTGALKFASSRINQNFYSDARLDLSALGIAGITRATVWFGGPDLASTYENYIRGSLVVNGAVAASATGVRTWTKVQATCDSNDLLAIRYATTWTGDTAVAASMYATGLEIYANADPYMLNQFVTYQGKMWKSLVDNNPATPVEGAFWTLALTLPSTSGTTAARPSASTAGAGFAYFDTTLGKPIWSNGTAWVDATGTVV